MSNESNDVDDARELGKKAFTYTPLEPIDNSENSNDDSDSEED